jgi:hypothetical protein
MLAAYGVDVLDPGVSTRRVHVLLERLPPGVRRPGELWSTEAELLAALIDSVALLTWVTLRAHGAKVGRPRPLPRPHAQSARNPAPQASRPPPGDGERKAGTWMDAAAMLGAIPGMKVHGDG